MCAHFCSLLGVDCIIFAAVPQEMCQSQLARDQSPALLALLCSLLIFLKAQKNCGPMLCGLVVRFRRTGGMERYWGGFEGL